MPLFRDKAEVDRGTPAKLQSRKEYQVVKNGKKKSALEENRVLYILKDGEIFQMTLRGTSMYAFLTYVRKTENVPAVMTIFGSEPKSKGDIDWNQMTFEVGRQLGREEVGEVIEKIDEIESGIEAQKQFYANNEEEDEATRKAREEFDRM